VCARYDRIRVCAELKANEIFQDVEDDFSIDVWPLETNQLRDDKFMKLTNRMYFFGDAIRNLDFERFFNRHDEFNGIETHVTPQRMKGTSPSRASDSEVARHRSARMVMQSLINKLEKGSHED
jgi:hypothetical protein